MDLCAARARPVGGPWAALAGPEGRIAPARAILGPVVRSPARREGIARCLGGRRRREAP